MTLEKLVRLRDRYAEKVTDHQDAVRSGDKKTIANKRRSMQRAGKAYLDGIDAALEQFTHQAVREITAPNP